MRGGRSPHPRGGFVPTAGSPTFRGRGKPWLNRGAAANGTPVIPPPPPAPVVQEAYNNGTQPAVYPTMPVYEQADYTANVYEDFGASYGK